jgi:hypothetical protein
MAGYEQISQFLILPVDEHWNEWTLELGMINYLNYEIIDGITYYLFYYQLYYIFEKINL